MKVEFKLKTYLIGVLFSLVLLGCGAQKSMTLTKENVRVVNREVSFTEGTLHLNAAESDGLAVLENHSFNSGTILFDIKGENRPGGSFVGIAFNIENDTIYEAIYFRPFNFESPEKIRREHSIQYVSSPEYFWRKLREENTGEFEAEYFDPPSPDDWFSISLTVETDKVIVKDADSGKLLMQSRRLAKPSSDKIGFWVGYNSVGSFRNFRIE